MMKAEPGNVWRNLFRRDATTSIETWVAIVSMLILSGCGGKQEPTGSHTKQLGEKDFACASYASEKIATHLKAMPQGFVDEASFRVGSLDKVKNQLAGIPSPYLDWLYDLRKRNGFRIAERNLGPGTMGVTMREMPSLLPLSVDLTTRQDAVDFALHHELGHAIEARVRELNGTFAAAIQTAFSRENRNPSLRSYARSNQTEFFAEAFANFYCSKEAQEFIGSNLPETYTLLKSSLFTASFDQIDMDKVAKDTWMQLVDSQEKSYLEISVPTAIKKVALCKGTREVCSKTPTVFMTFVSSPTKVADRNVFRSENSLKIEENLQVSILVYDGSDKPTVVRSVEFVAAGGP